jgi:hypothetical protein
LIELWETYLLQLDSDEDGPPLMPAGVHVDSEGKSDAQLRREAAKAQLDEEYEAEAAAAAAASTTRRDDEGADDDDGTPSLSGTTAVDDGVQPGIRASEDAGRE